MYETNTLKVLDDIEFNKEVFNSDDEEMRELAKEELPRLMEEKEEVGKRNPQYADTKRSAG